jgi:diacylglycerol O-acyltransferase / wax synthase
LNVLVPVGFDHGDGRLGNQVSAMLVRLPVSKEDPAERLQAVAQEVRRCKGHHQARATGFLVGALDYWPQIVVKAASRFVAYQPFVNMVVTNVPGLSTPLYAMGARMLEVFPFVPLAGNLNLGVAALSYTDQLSIGLVADRDHFPDLDELAHGIEASFGELVG